MAWAAIFPGQGAQTVGMGRDVFEKYPAAAEVYAAADQILGFDLSRLCFEGPAERLNATDVQQPAIFVTSVALYRAGLAAGRFWADSFVALGGLSLGEYTALHLADAVSFPEALNLVVRRSRLMQQACEKVPGGMVSLIGADDARVGALCARVANVGRISPANYNCPGQIVISGDRAACAAAAELAAEFELRAVPLPVAGAFHSELMHPAADGLKAVLEATDFRVPRVRVVSNLTGDYHSDPAAIRNALYHQLFSPVRWQACVERMIRDGCDHFWEIGPNRHLVGMLRKIDRKLPATNIGTAEDLQPPQT